MRVFVGLLELKCVYILKHQVNRVINIVFLIAVKELLQLNELEIEKARFKL